MNDYIIESLKRYDSKLKFFKVVTLILIISLITLGCILNMGIVFVTIPIILFIYSKKLSTYKKVRNTLLLALIDNKQ